jgi:mRNA interferase RelE/StbE
MEREKYLLHPAKKVSKFLSKQDEITRNRLIKAMEELQLFPPTGDIKNLSGSKGWLRLRVGKFRIIFTMDHVEKIVHIESIASRGDIYKDF